MRRPLDLAYCAPFRSALTEAHGWRSAFADQRVLHRSVLPGWLALCSMVLPFFLDYPKINPIINY